jgi:hypothetical protein
MKLLICKECTRPEQIDAWGICYRHNLIAYPTDRSIISKTNAPMNKTHKACNRLFHGLRSISVSAMRTCSTARETLLSATGTPNFEALR